MADVYKLESTTDLGGRFAKALAAKDSDALRAVLRPDVNFRAMTPDHFWEANDAARVVDDILLSQWFAPTVEIVDLLAVETVAVSAKDRVGYRLKIRKPDGEYLVEQQAFYEADEGRIGWLRVMCAGFLSPA